MSLGITRCVFLLHLLVPCLVAVADGPAENAAADSVVLDCSMANPVMLADKKTMLTANVNYRDVPMNEEVWASVYLSPAMLLRMLETDNAKKDAIRGYAVEFINGGEIVGGEAKPGKKGGKSWWHEREVGGSLIEKSKTPFRYLWWDRYAEEIAD